MVGFKTQASELCIRSMLESFDVEHTSNQASARAKILASRLDANKYKDSDATMTISWSKASRYLRVQGPGGFLWTTFLYN